MYWKTNKLFQFHKFIYFIHYLNHLYGRLASWARRFLALGLIPSKGAVATLLASSSSGWCSAPIL